jgi:hypothetical protein
MAVYRRKSEPITAKKALGPERLQVWNFRSWAKFHEAIDRINRLKEELKREHGREFRAPLFRGLGDAWWALSTTLERSYALENWADVANLGRYYALAKSSSSAIETVGEAFWSELPEPPDFQKALNKHIEAAHAVSFLSSNQSVY